MKFIDLEHVDCKKQPSHVTCKLTYYIKTIHTNKIIGKYRKFDGFDRWFLRNTKHKSKYLHTSVNGYYKTCYPYNNFDDEAIHIVKLLFPNNKIDDVARIYINVTEQEVDKFQENVFSGKIKIYIINHNQLSQIMELSSKDASTQCCIKRKRN